MKQKALTLSDVSRDSKVNFKTWKKFLDLNTEEPLRPLSIRKIKKFIDDYDAGKGKHGKLAE